MNRKNIALKRAVVKDVIAIGVDIGKFWHFACALLPTGEFTKPFRFSNDACGFDEFMGFIVRLRSTTQKDVIVGMESTGHYWENLAYFLDKHGVKMVQVNPAHTKKAKELLDNTPNKTDPKDSIVIADLVAQGKFHFLNLPRGIYLELRMLTKARQHITKEQNALSNTLNSIVDMVFPELTRIFPNVMSKTVLYLLRHYLRPAELLTVPLETLTKQLQSISRGTANQEKIEKLYEAARHSVGITVGTERLELILVPYLARADELALQKRGIEKALGEVAGRLPETRSLVSLKGVGLITAAMILGETGSLKLYHNAGEIIKLAGLNLYRLSSGKHAGRVRITKRGRPLVRWLLYFAALRQSRPGMPLYHFYKKLVNRGVCRMKVLIAVARKLLRVLFALVRDGREYTVEWSESLAA